MAKAALAMNAEPVSDENDDIVSVRSELSNSTSSKSRKRTSRASQADFENLRRNVSEIDKRFSKVDSKLDRLKGHCLIFLSAIYQLFIKYFNIK